MPTALGFQEPGVGGRGVGVGVGELVVSCLHDSGRVFPTGIWNKQASLQPFPLHYQILQVGIKLVDLFISPKQVAPCPGSRGSAGSRQ